MTERADDFLRDRVPPEEFALLSENRRLGTHRYVTAIACLAMAVIIPGLVSLLGEQAKDAAIGSGAVAYEIAAGIAACGFTLLGLVAYVQVGPGMLTLLWLRRFPEAMLYKAVATVLDSTRPGHLLRWMGLALFIVGFHFDLLSS